MSCEVTLEFLKKDKQAMTKWKVGSKYIFGYADFLNGRTSEISIFQLINYKTSIKFEDDEGIIYDATLSLKNVDTEEVITIDQDDRYGKYPLLNKKRKEEIENKLFEAQETVNILQSIVSKF